MNRSVVRCTLLMLVAVLGCVGVVTWAADDEVVEDVPGLPRVLIVGDSIGLNYGPFVRERLAGQANVHIHRIAASQGGQRIARQILDAGPWDLIHFNVGLWDMAYRNDELTATLDVYERNLRNTTRLLQTSKATLIFATTTPVPDGTGIRIEGDEVNYNRVAESVMQELGVPVFDLHAVAAKRSDLQLPNNVHYTKEGYRYLAEAVADRIVSSLSGTGSSGVLAGPVRVWYDARGASLSARLVAADGERVTFERADDGSKLELPISALRAADQVVVRQWMAEQSK